MTQPTMKNNISAFLHKHRARLETVDPHWVDGGAYKGEFIDAALCLRNDLHFDAFEPQPSRARKLQKKYGHQPNVRIHANSLGDCNTQAPLYITAANTLSSLLPPLPEPTPAIQERLALTMTVQVEQVCLETILDSPPGLVKLDIQGMELAALQGLGRLLSDTAALLVERSPKRRYQGEPDDETLHSFITNAGFILADTLPNDSPEAVNIYDALYFRGDLP